MKIPDRNTGVAFISDIFDAHTGLFDSASVFECLRDNYEQLRDVFDLNDEAVMESFQEKLNKKLLDNDDLNALASLNRKFETRIRNQVKSKYVNEKVNNEQNFIMIISIAFLLAVTF